MPMYNDIIAQLSAALVPLLGAVCGYLAGKLRAAAKRAREKDAADRVGQAGHVTGWISVTDAGVQTQPADKPGTTLTIGPVSSGDWGTIRSKCQELALMSLYTEQDSTITVGPLSAGDVATLKALCEQLKLVEMGLYKES